MTIVKFSGWYAPELCQAHPDKLFVFGDNLLGYGKGGQAVIRDEPNAFGIPTKRKPAMTPNSFFEEASDSDLDAVLKCIGAVWAKLKSGQVVVIPVNGEGRVSLGLERAELPQRAPSIYKAIETHVQEMSDAYGVRNVAEPEDL